MTFVVVSCTICFAVPNPGGQASIKPDTGGLPYGATPPTTIHKTSNVSAPLPTNKWFTSVLYNGYHAYSLKMYTYPQNFMCNPNFGQSKGIVIGYPKVQYSANSITYGYDGSAYAYPNNIKISGYSSIANGVYIDFDSAKLDGYSDFSATIKWEKATNWMKSSTVTGNSTETFRKKRRNRRNRTARILENPLYSKIWKVVRQNKFSRAAKIFLPRNFSEKHSRVIFIGEIEQLWAEYWTIPNIASTILWNE